MVNSRSINICLSCHVMSRLISSWLARHDCHIKLVQIWLRIFEEYFLHSDLNHITCMLSLWCMKMNNSVATRICCRISRNNNNVNIILYALRWWHKYDFLSRCHSQERKKSLNSHSHCTRTPWWLTSVVIIASLQKDNTKKLCFVAYSCGIRMKKRKKTVCVWLWLCIGFCTSAYLHLMLAPVLAFCIQLRKQ